MKNPRAEKKAIQDVLDIEMYVGKDVNIACVLKEAHHEIKHEKSDSG